jgi:hypothetical protein
VTPHSIVRSLPLIGWKLTATAKGADDVTMIDAVEKPHTTEVEVILGVDTHLDFHTEPRPWSIWAEKPGRGQRADDGEGLRKAPPLGGGLRPPRVRRGRSYKQLRSLMLARHLRRRGIEVLEVERPERRRLPPPPSDARGSASPTAPVPASLSD